MKTTKKPKKKPGLGTNKIQQAYIDYVLENEKRPANVFKFCKTIGSTEDSFYESFGSFKALEKAIWEGYAVATISRLKDDKNYASFSAREKVLAFYFTLVEILKSERSFVLYQLKKWKVPTVPPSFLRKFRKSFDAWAAEVIEEGKGSEEIAKRPYLDKQYAPLLWFHLHFILRFWGNDDSRDFEKTDEAIEKSVNLAFDLIGKGVIDNAVSFGKFLFQQVKN